MSAMSVLTAFIWKQRSTDRFCHVSGPARATHLPVDYDIFIFVGFLCPSKSIQRSGERLTILFEIAFSSSLGAAGFSMFNPLPKLSLSYPPLTAYLERRQLVDFDHPVESALGNLKQCRSLVKRQ